MKKLNRTVDLHVHTSASDSRFTPTEAVVRAAKAGLSAIAITDHDTVAGLPEAREAGGEHGVEIVVGVELSTVPHVDGPEDQDFDLHMLGYLFDPTHAPFLEKIEKLREERLQRGQQMVERLNELGVDLRVDTVMSIAGDAALGRPHVAEALLQEEFVTTYDEAFARYLGYHAPAYVPKSRLPADRAIRMVHEAGGVAVMAHPGTTDRDDLIEPLVDVGLDGIEAEHGQHTPAKAQHYREIARRYGLAITGGSDCHGARKGKPLIGTVRLPYDRLDKLRAVRERRVAV
jgi:predicted metal-dependent phosphoesterase TrpH